MLADKLEISLCITNEQTALEKGGFDSSACSLLNTGMSSPASQSWASPYYWGVSIDKDLRTLSASKRSHLLARGFAGDGQEELEFGGKLILGVKSIW